MFALYIHWPFCLNKCPYCDFNSHRAGPIDQAAWRTALLRELDYYASETKGRKLASIFFGGGTPSLMAVETVAALIERASGHWSFTPDIEITLEANPTSSEAERFRDYRAAGVNRLSLGIQSFDDAVLAFLGRQHSAAEGRRAIDMARESGARLSFDLIYGVPNQTLDQWRDQMRQAIDLSTDHLSLYQLTIEHGTAFFRSHVQLPDQDHLADLYDITQETLGRAGLPAYEISNHARPGDECRHNLVYWRGGDYVGIGPGAHGRLRLAGDIFATHQIHSPQAWRDAVERTGHGTAKRRLLSPGERADELLILGLRLTQGIHLEQIAQESGVLLRDHINQNEIEILRDGGLLEFDGQRLRATDEGRQRLNGIIARLAG